MDSVHHIWCPLSSQEYQDLPDGAETTLTHRCRNGYEKLQVFRLLELDQDHPVIRKFVNETYHIENEFICQLDPSRFDLIPEYVITECDNIIALPPAANQSSVSRTA